MGHLLQAVLGAAPEATGVLFELPAVIEHAAVAATDRLSLQAGDFFTDQLPAADTYLIMDVIHDWDDDQAVALLSAVRKAAPPQARVLVIETILADVPGPDWSKIMDVIMLSIAGGRQRSSGEHERLLNTPNSGWNGSSRPCRTCRSSRRPRPDLARRPGPTDLRDPRPGRLTVRRAPLPIRLTAVKDRDCRPRGPVKSGRENFGGLGKRISVWADLTGWGIAKLSGSSWWVGGEPMRLPFACRPSS